MRLERTVRLEGTVRTNRLKRLLVGGAALAMVGAGALAAPVMASAASSTPTIVIGSTNFEEQTIVANLYGDVLQKAGYSVKVEPSLGTRAIVVPALEKGQLDIEPDYAGALVNSLAGNNASLPAATQLSTAVAYLKSNLAADRGHGPERRPGPRHERLRRHPGDGQEVPPDDAFQSEAGRLQADPRWSAGVPDQRRLRGRPEEDLWPQLRQLQVAGRGRTVERGRPEER